MSIGLCGMKYTYPFLGEEGWFVLYVIVESIGCINIQQIRADPQTPKIVDWGKAKVVNVELLVIIVCI